MPWQLSDPHGDSWCQRDSQVLLLQGRWEPHCCQTAFPSGGLRAGALLFCSSSSLSRQYSQQWGCHVLNSKTVLAVNLPSNTSLASHMSFDFPGHCGWELGPVQTPTEASMPTNPLTYHPFKRQRRPAPRPREHPSPQAGKYFLQGQPQIPPPFLKIPIYALFLQQVRLMFSFLSSHLTAAGKMFQCSCAELSPISAWGHKEPSLRRTCPWRLLLSPT